MTSIPDTTLAKLVVNAEQKVVKANQMEAEAAIAAVVQSRDRIKNDIVDAEFRVAQLCESLAKVEARLTKLRAGDWDELAQLVKEHSMMGVVSHSIAEYQPVYLESR